MKGNAVIGIIVMAIGAIVAVILGLQIGQENLVPIVVVMFLVGCCVYVLIAVRHTWLLVMLLTGLGFKFRPLGFEFDFSFVAFLFAVVFVALGITTAKTALRPPDARKAGLAVPVVFAFIWCLYGAAHFAVMQLNPVSPVDWGLGYALKTYFEAFGMPAILLMFTLLPSNLRMPKGGDTALLYVLVVGLLVNVALRAFMMSQGYGVDMSRIEYNSEASPLYVPIVNMLPNFFILRASAPLTAAIGLLLLTSQRWMNRSSMLSKLVALVALFGGVLGALLSEGRATILFTGLMLVLVALYRRHIGLLFMAGMAGFLFLVGVNVFSHWIKWDAPFVVSRGLQLLLIDRGGPAWVDIQASDRWRDELHDLTLMEWESHPRVYWTGRSSYKFGERDVDLLTRGDTWKGSILVSQRRGKTHSMTTDLLIQYGVIGAILYYLFVASLFVFLIRLVRRYRPDDPRIRDMVFLFSLHAIVWFPYCFFGGNFLPASIGWELALALACVREYPTVARVPKKRIPFRAKQQPVPHVRRPGRFRPSGPDEGFGGPLPSPFGGDPVRPS